MARKSTKKGLEMRIARLQKHINSLEAFLKYFKENKTEKDKTEKVANTD